MKRIYLLLGIMTALIVGCSKKENSNPSAEIKIVSLTETVNPVIAYDTTIITVVATGENLKYGWVANHGKIKGSGTSVKYSACQSCRGMNTITCRVFNETGEVSDTIMIRVTPWHSTK
ncbi:MAG TPA: hypothetical protein PKN44_15420 [Bacteroidales bacterium]|nr:hypothetical protein [Bacteroidales bacterium]